MVEDVRRRLRALVALIEKGQRAVMYTDFTDELGDAVETPMPRGSIDDFAQFRKKALAFMRDHDDHLAIHRLRRNQPITNADVAELERMLTEIGGTDGHLERAASEAGGLGLFVRSLVGIDRGDVDRLISVVHDLRRGAEAS
jgi:type I restriction enzyme, R subunit